ncbi:Hypothetical predicted protein [Mytilus galloprovincialis]|uniref:Uncharacterized protein n=1 Tax=Mytilus galloprovincialis TaxID=29158 RepID=A0A8B6EI56_MYTGA|nr:Hypothetical predicted protein [Mytilus galloprovincialis]
MRDRGSSAKMSHIKLPDPFINTNWVIKVEIKRGHAWKVNMSFPDYVAKFRRKMVEIRSRFRETARLGLYADYWVPPLQSSSLKQPSSSSSTPTVPYSTTDILYGNEVRNSPQLDEIRQNSFIEYSKDKDRHSSNNLVDFNNRRPASKGGSRKSLSIEKVNFNKESDDNLRPILPSPGKNGNQYRPNGLRNGLLKGDPLYGSRGGRESDDLIAMGTIWSPNTGPQKNSGSNSANGIQNVTGKSVSMVASNSSTTVARKNVKPIMVQNSSSHGRSSFKEVEPRYTDPVIGAQPSFQQRLMELSALESETIRYEKSKKVKKKVRDRDS